MPLPTPILDLEAPAESAPSYRSPGYASAAKFLANAATTGVLGSGPAELPPSAATPLRIVLKTIPWCMLVVEAFWSSAVMMIAYAFADRSFTSLSVPFWTSSFLISSSVVYGVGWALFVLLGFFIREASSRHRTAHTAWNQSMAQARITIRVLVQVFTRGLWHQNDQDRIIAHFMAYPIALKMMIRNEREPEQLSTILDPLDVDDVIQSEQMHIHCIRVIRGYFSCAENEVKTGFQPACPSVAGPCSKCSQVITVDAIDSITATITRIAEFQPALGYVNHLRIFLYIWLVFLPLALVETSGWFTPLWAILISYGVGMLFEVANALNEPFGFDIQDIRLNRLASIDSLRFLDMYHEERLLPDVVKIDHDTPHWLENELRYKEQLNDESGITYFKNSLFISFKNKILLPLLVFLVWLSFIVFLTRGISEESPEPGCRWWCLYVPLSVSTTSYVGLGVFLLMGFWFNEAYTRYSTGLEIWESTLKSVITTVSTRIGIMCKNGTWHNRDIERLFSHIVAIAYAGKQRLQEQRDLSEFEAILAPEDIQAMSESKHLLDYCFRVLYGYISSMDRRDKDVVLSGKRPLDNSLLFMFFHFYRIENAINECITMQEVPISPSFTLHLQVFSIIWLALLPLAFVQQNGFFSYLYLPPIAYSIVKLLVMGQDLSDPFGTDPNDIRLDKFCAEIKVLVHEIYEDTRNGPIGFLHESIGYEERFNISFSRRQQKEESHTSHMTLKQFIEIILSHLPPVPWISQIVVTTWIVSAVFISYGLSFTWDDERRNTGCRKWCSPIDVDQNILLETGFALFLILSFRASDAMRRYQNSGSLISKLEMELRASIMEITNGYQDGVWHKGDKPRFISHLMQIPLLLRDELLGTNQCNEERLLSDEDYEKCVKSLDPIRYCIQTWEAYLLTVDVPKKESGLETMKKKHIPGGVVIFQLFNQCYNVGNIVSQLRFMKKFPVIRSYTNHQKLFAILWLILLPLGMTARTGFFTILWAPLISYGILALEFLATTLVDPLGDDELDIPVNKILTGMVERLIEAVRSTKWDYKHHIKESPVDGEARIGTCLDGMEVRDQYSLPTFTEDEVDASNFAEKPIVNFNGPKKEMIKPSLFAHMARSVPWWALLFISVWAVVGVVISYLSRTETENVRWWESSISIDGVVVTYVGFPAFLLLGFYVQAAFDRYSEAGNVWGDDIRAACHSLAVQWILLERSGSWHEGDTDRVLAHLACFPVALKMELRNERDLRELKGLLSEDDIGRILTADSMSDYCIDVIRAYYISGICRPEHFSSPSAKISGNRSAHVKFEIENLQESVRQSKFLKSFPIARGFMILLRALIGLWFIFVPFVLTESNGWFSILWVPLIGYGLLGMYSVAQEIQQPFGRDLNDFDLDKMANIIVSEILFVRQNYRRGCETLVVKSVEYSGKAWENLEEDCESIYAALGDDGRKVIEPRSVLSFLSMIAHAVPLWMVIGVGVYCALLVLLAWGLSQKWPLNESCSPAFCSPIAIDGVVKEYVGFALFVLLGFRLYDSHGRYVSAVEAWRDKILSDTIVLSNRMFELFAAGMIHKGDLERIGAHLAGFSIVTVARLRRERSCAEELKDVMNGEDIARIERVTERGDYCIDVIRAYLTEADKNVDKGISSLIVWTLLFQITNLKKYGAQCERIVGIALPFGYVAHIRILIMIWLSTLPLGLVESNGWWTIGWVVVIAYGVIGIERWSAELADPFGTDVSDVPLGKFRVDAVEAIRTNLRCSQNGSGSGSVVKADRGAFPINCN